MALLRTFSGQLQSSSDDEDFHPWQEKRVLHFERLANRIASASNCFLLFRAKVPGGWLVAMRPADTLAFVPDPDHEWDGGSLP